jgi:hypothetical protein
MLPDFLAIAEIFNVVNWYFNRVSGFVQFFRWWIGWFVRNYKKRNITWKGKEYNMERKGI